MAVSAKELPPDSSHEGDAWLSGGVCRVRTTLPYEIVCVQMPNSFGVRARTRDLFAKRWGTYGMPSMKTYLTTFKRGDIVDIVANPAIHKGFPFKHYQVPLVFQSARCACSASPAFGSCSASPPPFAKSQRTIKHRLPRRHISLEDVPASSRMQK